MIISGLSELGEAIAASHPQDVIKAEVRLGELVLSVRADGIVTLLAHLRDDPSCQFCLLLDICGADYPERERRFDVVYNLLSLHFNRRVRVKIEAGEDQPVPSVTGLFPAAAWYEREAWDLFGIFFSGHPDLRRLLTDYGFEGHPLRKDFPLTGYVEVRYDEDQKRVVYEPVNLTQEFRTFDFLSPWEGPHPGLLPGDEKALAPGPASAPASPPGGGKA